MTFIMSECSPEVTVMRNSSRRVAASAAAASVSNIVILCCIHFSSSTRRFIRSSHWSSRRTHAALVAEFKVLTPAQCVETFLTAVLPVSKCSLVRWPLLSRQVRTANWLTAASSIHLGRQCVKSTAARASTRAQQVRETIVRSADDGDIKIICRSL